MKQITRIIVLLFGTSCFSQTTEFAKSSNGLIYSDTTVKQLKHIVDSLNLKFKVCEMNKTYLAKAQTKAHYVSLDQGEVKAAKKDIEANISFDDFIKKYDKSKIERELLVVKFKYKNDEENDVLEFSSIQLNKKYHHEFTFEKDLKNYNMPLKGKWIYKYHKKNNYENESIDAFYFIEDFSQAAMADVYARMIQYSDCMVDTNARVFFDKAHTSGVMYISNKSSKSKEFMDYLGKGTYRPDYPKEYNEKDYAIYSDKYQIWDSLKYMRIDSLRNRDGQFDKLLDAAVKETIVNGGSDDEFEDYVGRYYSRKTELELKRNRRVMGGCSMDNSPRVHALNIAKLSAETINWEVFLRSHLDIMNDRFERVSDGSYAWERRKTYIKELEVLDINVLDLLLGITLRIENPSNNHYYGNISRLGIALSETNRANEIETKMLQMISDQRLDDYNRILIYYLFLNYNYNIDDKENQKANQEKLMTAVKTLPIYLASKLEN